MTDRRINHLADRGEELFRRYNGNPPESELFRFNDECGADFVAVAQELERRDARANGRDPVDFEPILSVEAALQQARDLTSRRRHH